MVAFIWPIALVVVSNILYNICAKSVPEGLNPFSTLTVTYAIGALCSAVLFFVTRENKVGFFKDLAGMNFAPYLLGLVIVGLEAGYIFAYRAGWQVSTAAIVQSSFLAVALIFVGYFLYHEQLTWNKLAGVAVCLVGLALINLKK